MTYAPTTAIERAQAEESYCARGSSLSQADIVAEREDRSAAYDRAYARAIAEGRTSIDAHREAAWHADHVYDN